MPDPSLDQSMRLAFGHHQAGRLAEAEIIYREILARHPNEPDTLHLLGMIAYQQGSLQAAFDLMTRAVSIFPDFPACHCNLGNVLYAQRQFEKAAAAYRRAIQLQPGDAGVYVNLANVLFDQGNFRASIAAASDAIRLRPTLAPAHYILGNAEQHLGNLEPAIAAYEQAIRLDPGHVNAHGNLGVALHAQGKLQAAIAFYQEAIRLKPDNADALNNMAVALSGSGQLDASLAASRRAIEIDPNAARYHSNLGDTLRAQGKLEAAIAACVRAIELDPNCAEAHNNLANALSEQKKFPAATAEYMRVLQLNPKSAHAHSNLGNIHHHLGNYDEAIAANQRAIALDRNYPNAHNGLGVALIRKGEYFAAIAACRRAIELKPDYPDAYTNLATAYKEQGQPGEAIKWYRKSVQLKPDDAVLHSNLCSAMYYDPDSNAASILAEHREWSVRHELPLAAQILPHRNDPSPGRRLKIGYISPDLCGHPVGRFLLPLLKHHDHTQFEIFCYCDVIKPDQVTQSLKEASDCWRITPGLSHEQAAEQIRRDQIDILIDLTGHTAHNRLSVFARKPAPVQATWLGCPTTTGLAGIDYRLSDAYLDPPDEGGQFSSEQLIRVPRCTWCYPPPSASPDVNPLPALSNGYVTFACFNNFAKVNSSVLNLWLDIFSSIPHSRLMLLCPRGAAQDGVRQMFESRKLSADRVEFVAKTSQWAYYERYHQVDICLDPFPFPGHTTTFDNLWMGVPVITLAGSTSISRGGVSILSNLGLNEFIARTPAEYLSIARTMSGNLSHLAQIRSTLRQTMQASPLLDAKAFAAEMESGYRQMWAEWCQARLRNLQTNP